MVIIHDGLVCLEVIEYELRSDHTVRVCLVLIGCITIIDEVNE
jgi:hypothetical protein